MSFISIIDYGSGNIKSVYNALNHICERRREKLVVTNDHSEIKKSTHLILPGVGSFESCINGLNKTYVKEILKEKVLENKTPFLGICVGMQMLATVGHENGLFSGLNWIKGKVKKIRPIRENLKIPHMGWNELQFKRETNFIKELKKKTNLKNVSAYFVHSYNFFLDNDSEKIVTTNYGQEITAMVSKLNIIGTQFHPEKSHNFGLAFLKTFLECEDFS